MKKEDYYKPAITNISENDLLDMWWSKLADERMWVSKSGNKKALKDLESAHLFNIRNGLVEFPESPGLFKLIGVITKILIQKQSKEEELPF